MLHALGSNCAELLVILGFSSGKESVCQRRRPQFNPWVGKMPWRRKWQPIPVVLPGKSLDKGAWQVQSTGLQKSWTRISNYTTTLEVLECFSALCPYTLLLGGQLYLSNTY